MSSRRRALLVAALVGAMAIIAAVNVLPVGMGALRWLEQQVPMPGALPKQVDGIVLLGGGSTIVVHRDGKRLPHVVSERTVAFMRLAHQYPHARLVVSGGDGVTGAEDAWTEAALARENFKELGFDLSRVTFEARSMNTFENAELSKSLVQPGSGETWILVTSAAHMPRALGAFRKVGWEVVPYPVARMADDMTDGEALRLALREMAAVVAYKATGRM